MAKYNVTMHRVVEHETTFQVEADSEDEAEELITRGFYDDVISDDEEGEMEDPEVTNIEKL